VARIRNTVITHKSYLYTTRNPTWHPIARRGATRHGNRRSNLFGFAGARARIIIQTLSRARFHNPLTFSANWVAGNYTLLYSRFGEFRRCESPPRDNSETDTRGETFCSEFRSNVTFVPSPVFFRFAERERERERGTGEKKLYTKRKLHRRKKRGEGMNAKTGK